MTTRNYPLLTIGLLLILSGLHWLTPDKTLLYFNAADITAGEPWRFVSGHFVHADVQHLFWNCLGLAVLGILIEHHSRMMLCAALVAGIVSVSALLLTPWAQLDYYCGLSGALNTLLLVALWLEWARTRSWLVIAVACGSIAKVVIEVSLKTSVLTHISWPPYAWAHVAGLAGGILLILALMGLKLTPTLCLPRTRLAGTAV